METIKRIINIPPSIININEENNLKTVTFSISRFFDGVDLSIKKIKINYTDDSGISKTNDAYLSALELEYFAFNWFVPFDILTETGEVSITVQFIEEVNELDKIYIWETNPKSYELDNTLNTNTENIQLLLSTDVFTTINDTEEPILIDGRRILMPIQDDFVVLNDSRSQVVSFTLPRFFDNVDLSTKTISIKYINAQGEGDRSSVINIVTTETDITFGWLIDNKVTIKEGTVNFAIEFFRFDDENNFYCWSTVPAQFKVSEGLVVDSIIEQPDPSWYQSFQVAANEKMAIMQETIDISKEQHTDYLLTNDKLKGTTQIVTLNPDETVNKVQHKDINNHVVREDVYTYNGDYVTEVRTLDSGESITMTYNLATYEIEII